MRRLGLIGVLVLTVTFLGACGDDDGAGTTTPTTAGATTTAATTTLAATTTTIAPTTTEAPTTTTSTLPADAHPVVGLSWAAVFPPEGATATYRVTTYNGVTLDLPASIETGVEWRGGTWDRLVLGTPEPGNEAIAVYFDRSEPWVFKVKGIETFTAATTTGPEMVEWFQEPLVFDANVLPDEAMAADTAITLELPGGGLTLTATYQVEVIALDEEVEVAAGAFSPTAHLQVTIGGDFQGGGTFSLEMWLHPEQFLVKATDISAFAVLELATPWE